MRVCACLYICVYVCVTTETFIFNEDREKHIIHPTFYLRHAKNLSIIIVKLL